MESKTLTGSGIDIIPIIKKRHAINVANSLQELRIPGEVRHGAELKILRVLLIGFNPVVREDLQAILATDNDIEPVVPHAANATQALLQLKQASAQEQPIHIALIEAHTGTFDGIQATKLIKQKFPKVAVLMLDRA